jgi:hypothetical protein
LEGGGRHPITFSGAKNIKFISSFIIAVFIFSTAVIIEEFIESIKVKNKRDFMYLIMLIAATILLYFNILKWELSI